MAEFDVSGLDALMLSLQQVAELPEDVQDDVLNAEADILVEEIRERGQGYGVMAPGSGRMLKAIKKGKVRIHKNDREIRVYASGSRKRGGTTVKNSEIAFLNNYGTRHQTARPFWTDAVKLSEKTMEAVGQAVYDRWLKSLNL
jgi:hypothetical protein|nr:hypothetical protein [uncultured Oscillibacter sp.]DAZ27269.1 MAG TPA: hypothetical protein [Caudoviricetes sp.]